MYRQGTLNSIPEKSEVEEESCVKWVPKKKHEVLKAKYKCLKKLFQIYDASVVGIFPEPTIEFDDTTKRRRKRSHRTKTDACAGTNEMSTYTQSECNLTTKEFDKEPATTSMHDLKIKQSCSTQIDIQKFVNDSQCETVASKYEMNASVAESIDNSKFEIDNNLLMQNRRMEQSNQFYLNEHRRLTRFQVFIQRVFGIRRDSTSDGVGDKRRRRGLRFRRLRRSKKIMSESDIKDLGDSAILSYVQSVQKSCLRNTTPRQCPFSGCSMVSYGIINYNDHLNLCHLKDRKFICHYCHEGFEKEHEKFIHEHEHIGLNRLSGLSGLNNHRSLPASNIISQEEETKASDAKLRKIVSFFDKITSQEVRSQVSIQGAESDRSDTGSASGKRSSSMHIVKCACACASSHASEAITEAAPEAATDAASEAATEDTFASDASSLTCIYCGEHFNYGRQLKLHVDIEHRKGNRFTKSHSCAVLNKPHLRCEQYSQSTVRSQRASPTNSQSTLDRRPHDLMFGSDTHNTQRHRFQDDSQDSHVRRERFENSPNPAGRCYEGRSERSQFRTSSDCDGQLNVITINNSRAKEMSIRPSTTISRDTLTPCKSQESFTSCDPSNIVYYTSSMASVKPSSTSVTDSLLNKMRSYKWEPGTKVIRA